MYFISSFNNLVLKTFISFMCIFFTCISKLYDSNSKNLLMEIRSEDETSEKLSFTSMTEASLHCLDDPDVLALIDPNLESPSKELLDDVRLFPNIIY